MTTTKTLANLRARRDSYYDYGGHLYGNERRLRTDREQMLGLDPLRPDLSDADRAVIARRRAVRIRRELNRMVDDMLEARSAWHEARAKRRPRRRDFLWACYCGAWRVYDHTSDCRATFGFLAYLAEGHARSCLTWDLNLGCKRDPAREGDCE